MLSCLTTRLTLKRRVSYLLLTYKETLARLRQETPLFFSAKRGGFSAQTIVNLFARFYALAGIKGASSHSGRRQFLTELADKGVNARIIQALARHKHLNTTMRYMDLNENKLRNAIELI